MIPILWPKNVPFSSLFSFQKWGKGKTPTFDEGEQSPLALYQKSALIVFESFWPFFFSRQRTKGDILDYLSVELGNRPKKKSLKRNWLSIPPSLLSPSEVTLVFFSVWNAAEMGANSTENGDRFEKCRFVISTRSASHYSHTAFEKWAS